MTSRSIVRFDISQVRVSSRGPQTTTLDGHITAGDGGPGAVLIVTVGNLAVYCYDLAAVRGFATAWCTAADFAPRVLPASVPTDDTQPGRGSPGVLLRVEGSPVRQRVNGIPAAASHNGLAHVRVGLDRLVIEAYDTESVHGWARCWAHAERVACRLWPESDAFDQADARERADIAKHGPAGIR